MIRFEQKDSTIRVHVTGKHPATEWAWPFECSVSSAQYATLLFHNLRDSLYERVEAIRRNAYEAGYNDRKKRKPARTWFSGSIHTVEM